jgi:serine/threonine protein kinase
MLSSGQVLQNRYRIMALLGQGGMGAVYRAWDNRLNVPVAIKEMTPQPGLAPRCWMPSAASSIRRPPSWPS